jgi:hypothetical protein
MHLCRRLPSWHHRRARRERRLCPGRYKWKRKCVRIGRRGERCALENTCSWKRAQWRCSARVLD